MLCKLITSIVNRVGATRWYPRIWSIDSHFHRISLVLQGKRLPLCFWKRLWYSHHFSGGYLRHREIKAKSLPDMMLFSQFPYSSTEHWDSLHFGHGLLKPNEEVFKMRLQAKILRTKTEYELIPVNSELLSNIFFTKKKKKALGFPDT